tara:strand:- start:458 stop:844 length:387 start_codon:yes stop_codon:yes gene_type:complete
MAKICPVCDKEIGFFQSEPQLGFFTHPSCESTFLQDPEKYGGKSKAEMEQSVAEAAKKHQLETKVEIKEHQKQQQRIEEKSVHVKSFDMPFGDMVMFMVKWAIASIPAFIILAIIGAIFFAIFVALFF